MLFWYRTPELLFSKSDFLEKQESVLLKQLVYQKISARPFQWYRYRCRERRRCCRASKINLQSVRYQGLSRVHVSCFFVQYYTWPSWKRCEKSYCMQMEYTRVYRELFNSSVYVDGCVSAWLASHFLFFPSIHPRLLRASFFWISPSRVSETTWSSWSTCTSGGFTRSILVGHRIGVKIGPCMY